MNEVDDYGDLHSVGVIQLFNKKRPITDEDIDRVNALQRFLGAAVTRVKIITASLTVVVGLSMIVDDQRDGL